MFFKKFMLTWFPRKVRGFFRCLKENGLGYTMKHFVRKLLGKVKYDGNKSIFKKQKDLNYCPICDKYSFFLNGRIKPRIKCVNCGSLNRHRLLWYFLKEKIKIMEYNLDGMFLHIAPEEFLRKKFLDVFKDKYISADLNDKSAMVKMDITNIEYPNESFEIIICNHVLEHIVDDIKAMKELYRVLEKNGFCILMVPQTTKQKTYEDFSINTPEEQFKVFGWEGHVRAYGEDFIDRLRSIGFSVEVFAPLDLMNRKMKQKMSLGEDKIFYCKKNSLVREQVDRINALENKLSEQNNFINEQRGRIDHLYWLSWYRAQRYAPSDKYSEILSDWYYEVTGLKLNLNNPRTFNEKIQWLKLYDSTPLKTRLADKLLVRDWVKEKIGEEYLIPLLGVYDSFDEIDFDALPNRFVLKPNHGSGWKIIVKNKAELNKEQAKRDMDFWMSTNFAYSNGLELQYCDIEPKIIVEQYMEDDTEIENLQEYRFLCFNDEPEYVWVNIDRYTNFKRNIYDLDWNQQPVSIGYPMGGELPVPTNLNQMICLTKILCKGFCHVRVDFYSIHSKIYFGEMTFTSMSGLAKFAPEEWNLKLGDLIKLPI